MGKYIVGVMALILIVVVGYYLVKGGKVTPPPDTTATTTPVEVTTSTYATSTFSVVYPSTFNPDAAYEYTQVNPNKPIAGVKFGIPVSMATGTNLSTDSYVSVEQLPNAKNCTGDIYLADNVKATSETDNGVTYSVATTSDAAAGNRYEETVYALAGSKPCTAVRYFIHYGAIENYPPVGQPGGVTEFDRAALLAAFDSIRNSLKLTSASTTQTP